MQGREPARHVQPAIASPKCSLIRRMCFVAAGFVVDRQVGIDPAVAHAVVGFDDVVGIGLAQRLGEAAVFLGVIGRIDPGDADVDAPLHPREAQVRAVALGGRDVAGVERAGEFHPRRRGYRGQRIAPAHAIADGGERRVGFGALLRQLEHRRRHPRRSWPW